MHERLKKLLEQEEKEQMRPAEHEARRSVLEDLRNQAHEALSGKLKGMKKVSVMSDSPEGLKEGLDKAEELASEAEHEEHSGKPEPKAEDLNALGDLENPPDMDQDAAEDFDLSKKLHVEPLDVARAEDEGDRSDGEPGDEFPEHQGIDAEEIDKRLAHLHKLKMQHEGKA